MTASWQSSDRSIVNGLEHLVVTLVGFPHRLGSNGRGVFNRCQLDVLELQSAAQACRVLEIIRPDVVVLDSHHSDLKSMSETVFYLLRILTTSDSQKSHLIILSSTGLSPELRRAFVDAGAGLVPSQLQTYRQISAIVRRLCGLPDGCCLGRCPIVF